MQRRGKEWQKLLTYLTSRNFQRDGDGVRAPRSSSRDVPYAVCGANPESQHYYKELIFISTNVPPAVDALQNVKQGANSIVDGKIVFDRSSVPPAASVAPTGASQKRELVGKEYTVDALVNREAIEGQIFYEQSGGGVTLSGGEVNFPAYGLCGRSLSASSTRT